MGKIFFSLLTILFTVTIQAQDTRQIDDESYQAFLEEQMVAMELSEEQQAEFITISDAYREKMNELRANDMTRLSKFKQAKKLIKDKDEEVKAILDEEQFQKYILIRKEKRKSRNGSYR